MKTKEELFEEYWKTTFSGMTDGDFIKYRNLGKSNAKVAFLAGIASQEKKIKELENKNEALLLKQLEGDHEISSLRKDLDFVIGGLVLHLRFSGALPNDSRMEEVKEIRLRHNLDKVEG